MNRRQFLVGGAAGVAAGIIGAAQAPAGGGQGRAGGRGRGANIPAEKLARISIMTLNFDSAGLLKLPWTTNPRPTQTIDILDLPQYYMEQYRVPNMEFQTDHLAQDPERALPDAEFFRQVRARLDAAGVSASQINLEIGGMGNLTGEALSAWLTRAKKWVDLAPILGCTRLMVIQDGLAEDTKANCIAAWKPLADYARPHGIKISAETRGGGGGRRGAAPAPPPARPAWMLLEEVIEASGGYSNVDLGGAAATNQQQLHDCIKGMFKTTSGNMHIKSSPYWDIGLAIRFTESLGYKGLYSIEVNPEAAIGIVYNTIIANL
jgi:Xylose isomerase-like TIM barrel